MVGKTSGILLLCGFFGLPIRETTSRKLDFQVGLLQMAQGIATTPKNILDGLTSDVTSKEKLLEDAKKAA